MPTSFPALGFDPCPGDPDALEALARHCRRTAAGLRTDVDALRRAPSAAWWQGDAARAFAGYAVALPRDLARAAASYEAVARALITHSAELRLGAAHARRTEAEAAGVDRLIRIAVQHREVAAGDPTAVAAAERRAAALREEHAALRRRAERLAAELQRSAERAARMVRAASDAPHHEPGLLHRLLGDAGRWVDHHVEGLTQLSGVLKTVSAVAGLLSLIPVLAPVCGPIAVAAAVVALGIDAALAARDRASWKSVAVDAGLSALPGVGKVGRLVVREVRTARGSVVVYRVEGVPNTRVVISPGRDVRLQGRNMLFLNFGQRQRAEEFLRTRIEQGMDGACIKSFRVRKEALEDLRAAAVDEESVDMSPGAPLRVDVSKAVDQFGLRKWHIRDLQQQVVPRSGRVLR
ncbi:MAG TPA: WXG100 family type VII secretion target [Candidatus Eisenbacteria bacterium]|nr:WXG100 family type VII secretion target [Candidatus Eisenbacteria bacterium]